MEPVDEVEDGQNGVMKEHAGARIAHDCADFSLTIGLVAVYRAIGTGGFIHASSKRASQGAAFNA